MEERPTPRPWLTWVLALTVPNVAVALIALATYYLAKSWPEAGFANAAPGLLFAPVLTGFFWAYVARRLQPSVPHAMLVSLLLTAMAMGGAVWLFKEGAICLIIASPIYYAFVLTGALSGRYLFRGSPPGLQLSILPALALLMMAEPHLRHTRTDVVTDEIRIHASPERIWPEVTAFPEIPAEPRFWLFRLGLPYPVATTSGGDFVGADRRCIFSKGAVFKERVAVFEPGRELAFDIVESPPDPELLGHLTPVRGQFELRDNGDGTTTLIGRTFYQLHATPRWYLQLWTEHIFRAVHLRVMEDIRRRAEHASRG